MDRNRFDAMAKMLAATPSRRAALGALIAAGITGLTASAGARKKHRAKGKGKKNRRVAAQAADCLSLGHGANVSGCNYAEEDHSGEDLSSSTMVGTNFNNAALVETDLSSSNMRNARFRGANLCGADLASSQLRNADLRNANLTRADLHSSGCVGLQTNAATVFCNTITCNGAIRNDDCPAGVDPEDVCCTDADCDPLETCDDGECVEAECDVCPSGCDHTTLQGAVDDAEPGDTIRICPGTYPTLGADIEKNLTIVGAGSGPGGTVLDAEGEGGRVLSIGANDAIVVIRDLVITGGIVTGDGGGIRTVGTLTLLGVTVGDNTSSGAGGGVFNTGTLTLGNGTLIELNSANGGGGIYNDVDAELTLQAGSRVASNTAGQGGGISNLPGATLTLQSGSSVENNTATAAPNGGITAFGTVTIAPGAVVANNTPENCEPNVGSCT